jgi:SAM-dependent methyltransferase
MATSPARLIYERIYSFNQYERDKWVASQAASIVSGSRVLDVGAGSCPYRSLFAHCDYKTHDFGRLQPGQLLGRKEYGEIDYVSDILSIPVPDASFDAILCTEVLEHVPRPDKALREFARILRPGAKLILTAPLGSGLHQEPYHFYGGFTPYWYSRFLAEAGFARIKVEGNGSFFRLYGQESIRFSVIVDPRRRRRWERLLLIPVWLVTLPLQRVLIPLLCFFLEGFDAERKFTVGYHVTAERLG